MAKFVFRDICIYYQGRDLSGELSSLNLEYGAETPDSTTLRDTARRRLPGLLSVSSTHNGWWDNDPLGNTAAEYDLELFNSVAANPGLISASINAGVEGEVSYTWQALTAEYSPGATVGEVFAFTFNTTGDSRLVRGTVMRNATDTTTTDSTATQVGAALATDTIYSSVHVVAASGTSPTLDLVLESDDAVGMATPVTRITHTQFTTIGAEQLTLVGPVTDDFWRYEITITGTTPSFTMYLAMGIIPTTGF